MKENQMKFYEYLSEADRRVTVPKMADVYLKNDWLGRLMIVDQILRIIGTNLTLITINLRSEYLEHYKDEVRAFRKQTLLHGAAIEKVLSQVASYPEPDPSCPVLIEILKFLEESYLDLDRLAQVEPEKSIEDIRAFGVELAKKFERQIELINTAG